MSMNPAQARGGNGGGAIGSKIQNGVGNAFGAIGGFVNGLATINRFKLASILVWFVGVYATSLVMNGIGNVGFNPNSLLDSITIGVYTSQLLGAFIAQMIFTIIEAPIFQRKGVNALSVFILILDTLVNAVVVGPFAKGFVNSSAWGFFQDLVYVISFHAISVNSVDPQVFTVFLTLFGGVAIAAAPEMLWSMGSRRG